MTVPLPPHGGLNRLTARLVTPVQAAQLKRETRSAPRVVVSDADLSTVRRLGDGALTPLEGFMTREVFDRVLDEERILVGGKSYAWTIPFSLPVTGEERRAVTAGSRAVLVDSRGAEIAVLEVEDVFEWDKARYNALVYGTSRSDHPGARIALGDARECLVGGKIHVFPFTHEDGLIGRYAFSPTETRARLQGRGWDAAIAFQTRNPLHRAHEYAMVYAVEKLTTEGLCAGVVLNPLVGETKGDDVPAALRMESYENLLRGRLLGEGDSDLEVWGKAGYGIHDVFDLFALDIKMFYGGPREAIMHGIYRQNYGFTHIIIGRRHADAPYDDGTSIWGDFDAQEKFRQLRGELLIQPIEVGFAGYFTELGRVDLLERHAAKGWKPVTVAGRVLREQLQTGQTPDPRIIRPETSALLIRAYNNKASHASPAGNGNGGNGSAAAETKPAAPLTWHAHTVTRAMREELNRHKGCTLWFTGLSASGKSTLANAVSARLHDCGARTYVLDGDNIRQGLNKGLGFSAADRQENIRRIAEVAKLFTDAGAIAMTAFISPYRADRDAARALQPESFLEIHVKAELSVCEQRDPKGLYRKARAGEIKGFTGIDDPYEAPLHPDLVIDTGSLTIEESVRQILDELERRGILQTSATAVPNRKEPVHV